jgi:hypothetical protein
MPTSVLDAETLLYHQNAKLVAMRDLIKDELRSLN